METGIKEKIGRWILLAEEYFNENIEILIKDINDNWFFGNIVLVGEKNITIDCTGPKHRKGQREMIEWLRVSSFEKAEEVKNNV